MRFDTLDAWLQWQEGLHPKAIDLGLDRVRRVAERLQLTSSDASVITVAGTNGKGSSLAMLNSIYTSAGYRVGLYTSPHVHRYNERIQIQGALVSDEALCEAFDIIDKARGDISLSYFEFGTLAALQLFSRQELDLLLLEVGLGGRLDAVNIIDPDLSLITSIDVDHVEWLGSDREQIGVEKAGIMRPGKPVVVSDPHPPASVGTEANRVGGELSSLGQDFHYLKSGRDWTWFSDQTRHERLPMPGLKGDFQLQNAAGVVAVTELLQDRLPVSHDALTQGLKTATVIGRLMQIDSSPEVLVDVAHNPQSTRVLAEYLSTHPVSGRQLAVMGVMADKDVACMLRPLQQSFDAWLLAQPRLPRALEADRLAHELSEIGMTVPVSQYGSIQEACQAARSEAQPNDRIVIFGSFYTVAEALSKTYNEQSITPSREKI
jgi:dihydrofolate synthase/folylpolyglutamate synthase